MKLTVMSGGKDRTTNLRTVREIETSPPSQKEGPSPNGTLQNYIDSRIAEGVADMKLQIEEMDEKYITLLRLLKEKLG